MPRLWNETIEEHRRSVREAIMEATWRLVAEHGLLSVTMSRIAEETGIGRATLYKYFHDVESILHAWHERQISRHLAELGELRDGEGDAGERLEAVLRAYAFISHRRGHHDAELGPILHGTHRREPAAEARQRLLDMLRDLIAEGAADGTLRDDVDPVELAAYCLHALSAAGDLPSEDAVDRLVAITLSGTRPQSRRLG